MSNDDELKMMEIAKNEFVSEMDELISSIEDTVLTLGNNDDPSEEEFIKSKSKILRDLHTLKGSAACANFLDFSHKIHSLEDFVTKLELNNWILLETSLLRQLDQAKENLDSVEETSCCLAPKTAVDAVNAEPVSSQKTHHQIIALPNRKSREFTFNEIPDQGLEGPTMILVDDEEDIVSMLQDYFSEALEGYHILGYTDPSLVMKAVGNLKDLRIVLSDYHMPNLNGTMLASSLKDFQPDCLVVMMSGHCDDIPTMDYVNAGIDHLLRKPTPLKTILDLIQAKLETRASKLKAEKLAIASMREFITASKSGQNKGEADDGHNNNLKEMTQALLALARG